MTERGPQLSLGLAPRCPNHDDDSVCNECPEALGTDANGFPHRTDAKGRRPLRRCPTCKGFVGKGDWNVKHWMCNGCTSREGKT